VSFPDSKHLQHLSRAGLLAALLCAFLGACQRTPETAPAVNADVPQDAASDTGWLTADGPGETAIVYKDAPDSPGFGLSCDGASKSIRVSAPNPLEGAPIDKETATLILGDQAFLVPVSAGVGAMPLLSVQTPAIPKLLLAVADAKSARLVFRDGFVETGVDTEGRFLTFSARCAALTGVTPGP
jgi:hypothetical protein